MVYQATEELALVETQSAEVAAGIPSSQAIELQRIESIEKTMLNVPQLDVPLHHAFAPNVYLRQVTMPKGAVIIGHQHKTEHFNIVLCGKATVFMEGEIQDIVAPAIFKSSANVRKVLFIHETMIWATVHPTTETNIEKLEEELVVKSDSFQQYQLDLANAKELMNIQDGGGK